MMLLAAVAIPVIAGIATAVALHRQAPLVSGWIAGPDIFVAYMVWLFSVLVGAGLLLSRKLRRVGMAALLYAVTVLAVFWALSAIWPPRAPEAPIPVAREDGTTLHAIPTSALRNSTRYFHAR
jgi:hypothetical protein